MVALPQLRSRRSAGVSACLLVLACSTTDYEPTGAAPVEDGLDARHSADLITEDHVDTGSDAAEAKGDGGDPAQGPEPAPPCPSVDECDDGEVCTVDACDESGCTHTPAEDGKPCDDGEPCTADDRCRDGACEGGDSRCDDLNPCTTDRCTSSGCQHELAATGTACDDEDPCTSDDRCDSGSCRGDVLS